MRLQLRRMLPGSTECQFWSGDEAVLLPVRPGVGPFGQVSARSARCGAVRPGVGPLGECWPLPRAVLANRLGGQPGGRPPWSRARSASTSESGLEGGQGAFWRTKAVRSAWASARRPTNPCSKVERASFSALSRSAAVRPGSGRASRAGPETTHNASTPARMTQARRTAVSAAVGRQVRIRLPRLNQCPIPVRPPDSGSVGTRSFTSKLTDTDLPP